MNFWHPGHRRLSQFAFPGEGEHAGRGVARHLLVCGRCRRIVTELRDLPAWLRSAPLPTPGPQTWSVIAARLDRDEVVLGPGELPVHLRRLEGRSLFTRARAVAALLISIVAIGLVRVPTVHSVRGELHFLPGVAIPGETIRVRYQATAPLSNRRPLVLRARFRRSTDRPRIAGIDQVVAAKLVRGSDGLFHGEFRFPVTAVYAAFAVEDSSGDVIDTDGGRHWGLSVGVGRRPGAAAMQQQAYDQMEYDFAASVITLRAAAQHFPDDPWRWAILRASAPETPEAVAQSSARYDSFSRTLPVSGALPVSSLEGMMLLGMLSQGEGSGSDASSRTRYEFWRDRLIADYPASWYAIDQQVLLWMRSQTGGSADDHARQLLGRLEGLWNTTQQPQPRLLDLGLRTAVTLGDTAAATAWSGRWLLARPWDQAVVASRLAEFKSRHHAAIALFRAALRDIPYRRERVRPLHVTRGAWAGAELGQRQDLLMKLGQLLIVDGRRQEGLDSLLVAATLTPRFDAAHTAVRMLQAAGDATNSAIASALLALDPISSQAMRDSVAGYGRRILGDSVWTSSVDAASERLASVERAKRVDQSLHLTDIKVQSEGSDGYHPFIEDLGSGLTLVTFWDPWCPYVQEMMPTLERLYPLLSAHGVKLLLVSTTSKELVKSYRASGRLMVDAPIVFDRNRAVSTAFRTVGTPEFGIVAGSRLQAPVGEDIAAAVRSALFRVNGSHR